MASNNGDHRTWQRFECKYFIDEARAAWIRGFCLEHLQPDPHSLGRPGFEYPISSLYLDSPDERCLRGTLERQPIRAKLRIRTYKHFHEPSEDLPSFLEIKRKRFGVVHKTRALVPRDVADRLTWNPTSWTPGWAGADPEAVANTNEFLSVRSQIHAEPIVGVYYTRQAYESGTGDRVRISLDRNLHYGLIPRPGSGEHELWWPVELPHVILEIKFTNTFPFWVADLVRIGNISRRGVCKLVLCSRAASTTREFVGC
ncbi:MAG: polyphosphate polymerase domain-containing protein [Planctomycetota bacterium]